MGNGNFVDYYIVYAAAFIVVAILIIVRQRLRSLPASGHLVAAAPAGLIQMDSIEAIPIGNAQTIGRREEQDDYFASSTTRVGTMAVIADGISGVSNGRMASTLAVTKFTREFLKLDDSKDIHEYFHKAAVASNRAILEQLGGAIGGTTLVVAVISDNYLHWGAVGDSVILLFREGEFLTINSKHTLESVLEAKYLSGEISKEEVTNNPMKNQLTNYLGYAGFKSMEVGEPIPLKPGDSVILCSDGVYDALTEVEMEQILMQHSSPQEMAEEMIFTIERKSYKHQDNATVIILEHEEKNESLG